MELTYDEAVIVMVLTYIVAWVIVIHYLREGLWGTEIVEKVVFLISLVWVALITIGLIELLVLRVGL